MQTNAKFWLPRNFLHPNFMLLNPCRAFDKIIFVKSYVEERCNGFTHLLLESKKQLFETIFTGTKCHGSPSDFGKNAIRVPPKLSEERRA